MVAQADVNVTVGHALSLTFSATDPDGDAVTYHLTSYIRSTHDPLPLVDFDGSTGEFTFMPRDSDKPYREFLVEANDGRDGKSSVRFKVYVAD